MNAETVVTSDLHQACKALAEAAEGTAWLMDSATYRALALHIHRTYDRGHEIVLPERARSDHR